MSWKRRRRRRGSARKEELVWCGQGLEELRGGGLQDDQVQHVTMWVAAQVGRSQNIVHVIVVIFADPPTWEPNPSTKVLAFKSYLCMHCSKFVKLIETTHILSSKLTVFFKSRKFEVCSKLNFTPKLIPNALHTL